MATVVCKAASDEAMGYFVLLRDMKPRCDGIDDRHDVGVYEVCQAVVVQLRTHDTRTTSREGTTEKRGPKGWSGVVGAVCLCMRVYVCIYVCIYQGLSERARTLTFGFMRMVVWLAAQKSLQMR